MTSDRRDDAAARALGPLSPADEAAFRAAAAADPALAADAAAYAATVGALESTLPRAAPPSGAGSLGAVLAAIREDEPVAEPSASVAAPSAPVAAPPTSVTPLHRRRRWARPLGIAAVAAAAACVLTLAIGALTGDDGRELGSPDARAVVAPATGSTISGEATLYGSSAAGGRLVVDLDGLSPAPAGHHYEVWVLREGAAEMEAVASFQPAGDDERLVLPLPGAGDFAAVDISVEDDGGSPAHSGTSVAGGAFAPA